MRTYQCFLAASLAVNLSLTAVADTRYVDLNCTNALSPFLDWSTAATNIQDAVDVALAGDEIVVTNGVYDTGGRTVSTNVILNRVVVDKPLTLRSANGPEFTIIRGYQLPTTTNGVGAIRCVYLTNGASLMGFTLTNGATRKTGHTDRDQSGGGAWCESTNVVITNCVIAGNSAYQRGAGAYAGTLTGCTVARNFGPALGGGAYSSTLTNCLVSRNLASNGGGVMNGILTSCTVSSNAISSAGGGVSACTLTNCLLVGNSADLGGGAESSTLIGCTLTGNSAPGQGGGGAYGGRLSNCTLTNNSGFVGGGARMSRMNDCVIAGNSAASGGGGIFGGLITNCLVSGNVAGGPSGGAGGGAATSTLVGCNIISNQAPDGAGTMSSTVYNSTYLGNSASKNGGGAENGSLYNCLVISNRANYGGGSFAAKLYGCTVVGNVATNSIGGANGASGVNGSIVYYNTSFGSDPNCANPSGATYSCMPELGGSFCITNAPLFIDLAGGNLRLQSNSPCINAGFFYTGQMSSDLDGNPRTVGGAPDIGAYECQSPALMDYFNWRQRFGLRTDAWRLYLDTDGEGMNDWQEWLSDTVPTNALSRLAMTAPVQTTDGLRVTWQSVPTRSYFLERGTNLAGPPPIFASWATGILGQAGTTTFTDTTATNGGPFFYRVGVQP